MNDFRAYRLVAPTVVVALVAIIWILAANMNTMQDNAKRLKASEANQAEMRKEILQNRAETLINRKLSQQILEKLEGEK